MQERARSNILHFKTEESSSKVRRRERKNVKTTRKDLNDTQGRKRLGKRTLQMDISGRSGKRLRQRDVSERHENEDPELQTCEKSDTANRTNDISIESVGTEQDSAENHCPTMLVNDASNSPSMSIIPTEFNINQTVDELVIADGRWWQGARELQSTSFRHEWVSGANENWINSSI